MSRKLSPSEMTLLSVATENKVKCAQSKFWYSNKFFAVEEGVQRQIFNLAQIYSPEHLWIYQVPRSDQRLISFILRDEGDTLMVESDSDPFDRKHAQITNAAAQKRTIPNWMYQFEGIFLTTIIFLCVVFGSSRWMAGPFVVVTLSVLFVLTLLYLTVKRVQIRRALEVWQLENDESEDEIISDVVPAFLRVAKSEQK